MTEARALAEDVVRQWFSRSLGDMNGWEKWRPIWTDQLTEQFTAALAQAQRETWEAAKQAVIDCNDPSMHRNDFANKLIGYFEYRQQAQGVKDEK
jgi:hypothetical protein